VFLVQLVFFGLEHRDHVEADLDLFFFRKLKVLAWLQFLGARLIRCLFVFHHVP
jgi:hypothetical protein